MRLGRALVLAAGVLALGALGIALRSARAALTVLDMQRTRAEKPAALGALDPLEDVTFIDARERTMHGWFHPGDGPTILLLHGAGDGENRSQLLFEMRALAEARYGFLAYDAPGMGDSDGVFTWGDGERVALRSAIDFVARRPGVDPARIGALGFSIGGVALALVAATDVRLRAVVLEGTFSTMHEDMFIDCGRWGALCAYPQTWALESRGIAIDELTPVATIASLAPRALLVVTDAKSPADRACQRRVYDAAGPPKELYEVAGALHGHYAELDGVEYRKRIVGFFDRALR